MALGQRLPLAATRRWSSAVSSSPASLSVGRRSRPHRRSVHAAAVCAGPRPRHAEHSPAYPARTPRGAFLSGGMAASRPITSPAFGIGPMHRESASTGALVLLGLASVSLTLGAAGTGSPADCEAARGPPGEEEEEDAGTDARTGTDDDTEPPGPAGGADVDRDVSDDEDDPANDEPTSCSICNINRQGPCRKYWLKFERCMKEHGREREERERREAEAAGEEAEAKESEDPPGADGGDAEDAEAEGAEPSLESQWDEFMVRSTRPGEDDDDDDDDEDDEDEEDEDDEDDESESEGDPAERSADTPGGTDDGGENTSLAERCDRFMLPWIGCIQSHRNTYSLISNAFYKEDYVDPLEFSIPDERRMCFAPLPAAPADGDGDGGEHVVRYHGAEVDLSNWSVHVEAEEDGDRASDRAAPGEDPHLINAYAKFDLVDPSGRPVEVAYVKDQDGRLLGFDSFSRGGASEEDGPPASEGGGGDADSATGGRGECTFQIVPGETIAVRAHAVYRGEAAGAGADGGDGGGSGMMREDYLYVSDEIPLPRSAGGAD